MTSGRPRLKIIQPPTRLTRPRCQHHDPVGRRSAAPGCTRLAHGVDERRQGVELQQSLGVRAARSRAGRRSVWRRRAPAARCRPGTTTSRKRMFSTPSTSPMPNAKHGHQQEDRQRPDHRPAHVADQHHEEHQDARTRSPTAAPPWRARRPSGTPAGSRSGSAAGPAVANEPIEVLMMPENRFQTTRPAEQVEREALVVAVARDRGRSLEEEAEDDGVDPQRGRRVDEGPRPTPGSSACTST